MSTHDGYGESSQWYNTIPEPRSSFPCDSRPFPSKTTISVREIPGIRVDRFDAPREIFESRKTHSHFLTHGHSDHTVGLASPYFRGTLYCTAVTKRIVLETSTAAERVKMRLSPTDLHRVKSVRKFDNLRRAIRTGVVRIVRHIFPVAIERHPDIFVTRKSSNTA